ncbi:hypothetical protein WS88_27950 [Burkholderia cepacia]|nr:hypothetical protein WS88_27950 [Burkholderia cepacia]KVK94845.1 hypothetical protein WS93_00810 [Burkholderia cepacia]
MIWKGRTVPIESRIRDLSTRNGFVLRPPAGTLFIHSAAATHGFNRRGAQRRKAHARTRNRCAPPFR